MIQTFPDLWLDSTTVCLSVQSTDWHEGGTSSSSLLWSICKYFDCRLLSKTSETGSGNAEQRGLLAAAAAAASSSSIKVIELFKTLTNFSHFQIGWVAFFRAIIFGDKMQTKYHISGILLQQKWYSSLSFSQNFFFCEVAVNAQNLSKWQIFSWSRKIKNEIHWLYVFDV